MALIRCPECGNKISDKATHCPHCGFQSANPTLPISVQDKYKAVPTAQIMIGSWKSDFNYQGFISHEDNKRISLFFGKWENLYRTFPAIALAIRAALHKTKEVKMVIDKATQSLIDNGNLQFVLNENGTFFGILKDPKTGKIVKNIPLEIKEVRPELMQSLGNLYLVAMVALVLEKLDKIENEIQELHSELQNDRLALAESTWDMFMQAQIIEDPNLRRIAFIDTIHHATIAKRTLMKNLTQNIHNVEKEFGKSFWSLIFSIRQPKDLDKYTRDVFQGIVHLTNSVQVECYGYATLGEYESCKECLKEFRLFVVDNKLNDPDTLKRLNESADHKEQKLLEDFSRVTSFISQIENNKQIEYATKGILPLTDKLEEKGESDEQKDQ